MNRRLKTMSDVKWGHGAALLFLCGLSLSFAACSGKKTANQPTKDVAPANANKENKAGAKGGAKPENKKVEADPKLALGEQVFTRKAQPSCKTCHVFKAADAHGQVGPNLDTLRRDHEQIVRAVTGGLGLMPAQKEILSAEEIEAVAHYVVTRRSGK